MRKLWASLGVISFWLSWPGLWLILHGSHRTRVLITSDNKVLLMRDWLGPGSWSLCGGGRQGNETSLQTAIREIHEEVGLLLSTNDLRRQGNFTSNEFGISYNYDLYTARLPQTVDLQPRRFEVLQAGWFTRPELPQLKLAASAQQALDYWS